MIMQKLKTFGIYLFCFAPEILIFSLIFMVCILINYNKLGCIIMGFMYLAVFVALYPLSKTILKSYFPENKVIFVKGPLGITWKQTIFPQKPLKKVDVKFFIYNPTLLELKTPCPICGKEEVVWDNVAEYGYISEWGDNIICKPKMQFPCPNCESQIQFDIGIEKDALAEWVENNLKFVEKRN